MKSFYWLVFIFALQVSRFSEAVEQQAKYIHDILKDKRISDITGEDTELITQPEREAFQTEESKLEEGKYFTEDSINEILRSVSGTALPDESGDEGKESEDESREAELLGQTDTLKINEENDLITSKAGKEETVDKDADRSNGNIHKKDADDTGSQLIDSDTESNSETVSVNDEESLTGNQGLGPLSTALTECNKNLENLNLDNDRQSQKIAERPPFIDRLRNKKNALVVAVIGIAGLLGGLFIALKNRETL